MRLAVQAGGFLVGLALLGWCASIALAPENRAQLDHLAEARPWQIALLLALSAATLLLNGATFWVLLLPVRRLRAADVVAVNTLATCLAYLPFKLSLVSRVLIHNRRDKVPIFLIGSWMAAFAAAIAAVVGPLILVSMWRGRIDGLWFAAAVPAVVLTVAAASALAHAFAGERGLARLRRLASPLPPVRRFLGTAAWLNLHHGFAMIGSPRTAPAWALLRLADVAAQAARFAVAAAIVGHPLAYDQALFFSLAYFLIGIVSPSGVLGTREGGTTALAAILAVASSESFAVIALLVTVTESLVNLAGAGLAVAWLRPDRLLRLKADPALPPQHPPEPPPHPASPPPA